MSTEITTSDATAPHFNSTASIDGVDEAPSSLTEGKEKMKQDGPSIIANATTQQSSKVNFEDLENSNKPSSNDDSQLQTPQEGSEIEKEATFYQNLAEEVLEDDEDERDVQRKAHRATFPPLIPNLLEEERDRVGTRSRQAILHIAYTDQRVRNLEKEIKKLRQSIKGLPEEFEVAKSLEQPVYLHDLKRSTIDEFRLNEDSKTIPHHLRPALEVLLDDRRPLPTSGSNENTTGDNSTGDRSPRRLRIRPKPLAIHLARITRQDTTANPPYLSDPKRAPSSIMLLRPFKLLVAFEAAIRASVPELEAQIEKKAAEAADSDRNSQQTKESKRKSSDYDDKDLLIDLKLLIEFLDVDLKSTFELRNKIKDGTATAIEYQDLWHLFDLGEDVIHQSNRLAIYRVINFTGGREPLIPQINMEEKPKPVDGFVIDCYNLNFNGSAFGPKVTSFSIPRFYRPRLIASLPIYPLKFDASCAALKEDLMSRGARYLELIKLPFVHKLLVGTTLDEPAEEVDAQVIVDMTSAINKNAQWHEASEDLDFDKSRLTAADKRETQLPPFCMHGKYSEGCCGSDTLQKDLELDKLRVEEYIRENIHALKLFPASDLAEKDKILLPHWVYGFVLRSRKWVTLNIDDLSDVVYGNNFDSLVLPEGHKETVRALVRNHARTSTNSAATSNLGAAMDLVRGKGKGLIILLHGEPGVGKTSTAECVADLTQRPLFPVTCGDIGETASEVQNSLDHNFQLAHKWGCVLLLDEADVFMAKRNKTDLRRNAVVSVFLRTLEYYSGILFLTTNRVGSIDPAFKSRIHMSLFYPHLGLEATIQLYKILLDRTLAEQKQSKKVDFKVKPNEILRFAKSHFRHLKKEGLATWNGRQIRNAFQTAITLAEYNARQPGAEPTTLGKAQFQIVAEASKEFDKYMKETLGATDADLARREDIRYDRFGVQPSINTPAIRPEWSKDRHSRHAGRNAKDPESESEESSKTSDDEVEDDEDQDFSLHVGDSVSIKPQGKMVVAGSSKVGNPTSVDQSAKDEYEEFLRFQEMKKKRRQH